MKQIVLPAAAKSKIVMIFVQDSSSAVGAGLPGLLYNSSGLTGYYKRSNGTASVAMTLVTIATLGTYAPDADSKCGFKEIDATYMPGFYELHLPNDCFKIGADSVAIALRGATNMAPVNLEFQLSHDIADDIFTRDMSAITGEALYSFLNSMRYIKCKSTLDGTTLTIYKENGTDVAWTGTVGMLAGANPIISMTPSA